MAAVITTYVVPYIKTKIKKEQRNQIAAWTKIAVTAAEQIYAGPGRGDEKKQYVLEFLQMNGYTIDLDSINALIESAVHDLTQGAEKLD
ncbi:Phage holin protein [compost metagenome]